MKPDEPSYKGENVKGADGIEIKPGDLVEWIDCGKHEGAVTLVDYNRIVVDGKHSVAAIDVYHKGKSPFNQRNSVAANASELRLTVFDELNDEEVMAGWYCDEHGMSMKAVTHSDDGTLYVTCENGSAMQVSLADLEKLDGVLQVTYEKDWWRVTRTRNE